MKFWITTHCRERYIERINNGLAINNNVLFSILNSLSTGRDITNKIYDDIPRYILYLYENYGSVGQRIIKVGDIIYIVKKRPGTQDLYDVLTCFQDINSWDKYRNTILTREQIFMKIKQIKKELR